MNKEKFKVSQHLRRRRRVRKKIFGDAKRPRLSVFRSHRNMYAQIIDDNAGITLVAASTLSDRLDHKAKYPGNIAAAAKIGEAIARKALALGIRKVRFDRSSYKYHGRIRALADASREAGLIF